MEVGDMQKVTAVWLRKTHAWQPFCLRRTTWVATRQHAFQNCACWFSIIVIHRPFLVNAQHPRVRPKDVPYSYHVSSTRSRRKLACESSAKEKLTESASGLGISVIDSTVMVNVQFLCVWPKGLPHGHVYVMAAHAPPHKLLQKQSAILKPVGPHKIGTPSMNMCSPLSYLLFGSQSVKSAARDCTRWILHIQSQQGKIWD